MDWLYWEYSVAGTEFSDTSVQGFSSHCSSSLSRYCILARGFDCSVLKGRGVLWSLFQEESVLTAESTNSHLEVSASCNSRRQWQSANQCDWKIMYDVLKQRCRIVDGRFGGGGAVSLIVFLRMTSIALYFFYAPGAGL